MRLDGWYTGRENLRLIRSLGRVLLGRRTSDRLVRADRGPPTRPDARAIAASGTVVWRPGYGQVEVLRSAAPDGGAGYGVTNDPDRDAVGREERAREAWAVETYHRGRKPYTGVERCPVRAARAQRNPIGLAIRALVRREYPRVVTGVAWFQAKWDIIRGAVGAYLAAPKYRLVRAATA